MAPIAKTQAPAPRVTTSSKDPAFTELAPLAQAAQTAASKVKELKGQLKAADAAFKANPKSADLRARRDALLGQTKTALGAQEKADTALSGALTRFGGKTPREQAAKLTEVLAKLDTQLTAARKANLSATAQFKKDVAAAEAAPKGSRAQSLAITKAEASKVKADKAAGALSQLEAVKSAVENAIDTKEGAALAEARAANVPGAKDVIDLTDLASKTREEQVRLVGAPVVGVTKEAAVALDVARISMALTKSPASAAQMLKTQLQGADWGQQQALIKAAAPMIAQMVADSQGKPEVAAVLLDALKSTSFGAREELAKQLAAGTTNAFSPMMLQLQGRLGKAEGLIEGVALRDAFKKAGTTGLATAIEGPLTAKVEALKADFTQKGEKVARLNTDLARLLVGFGPMLAPEQRQAAIEAFKTRHKEDYASWEASGAKLAPAVQYAMEGNDPKLEALIPDFLATKAGEDSMMQALALQADGKPSLLDRVPQLVRQANEGVKLAGHVTTALVKGVAMKAIELTRGGKLVEAQALLHGLEKNAALFGLSADAMEGLTSKMSDVLKGGGQASVNALKQEFQDVETNAPHLAGRPAQALKGLALALSAVAITDKIGVFDALSLKDQVTTIAEGVGVGVDGGLLAMEVIGRSSPLSKLLMVGKSMSAAAGAVSAVMDGVSAVQAFRNGEHAEGIASSTSAVGGAILATAAFSAAAGAQVIPVAGQVIGVVLVVGGTIAKWTIEERRAQKAEDKIEGDAKAFLEAAGVDAIAADELSDLLRKDGRNVGPFIQQVAKALGKTPTELFETLKGLERKDLQDFVKMSKDWPVDAKGQFKRTGPESLEVALIWLKEDHTLEHARKK